MDDVVGLLVLVGLAVLAMPVLLIVALVSVSGLKRRVATLEAQVAQLRAARVAESAPAPASTVSAPAAPVEDEGPTLADLMRDAAPPPRATPAPAPAAPERAAGPPPIPSAPQTPTPAPAAPPMPPRPPRPVAPSRPDFATTAVRAVQRWFTVGNVPVKIGMLVLFAGVAALLKYGADQGWFTLPPELRLAGVAAAALGALVFAWRKRESNRVFALSLQGGAIGVLLLVVFAAFKIFGLMPVGAAFALSIALVAGAGMLAVLQDAKALAVFALLAGFLAPIWLSTGSGNHVALFSYYALLNAAIVGIAWYKSWRLLNLLGFVFTFGIGTVWGLFDYDPAKYGTTQPFLALFFVFYLLIPLLFARRQPASRRDFIDGCLVFGMPLVAFSLQAGLMQGGTFEDSRMPLAFCALGLGVLYAGLSWLLRRRENYDVLAQSYALLAVGFATLAVPLALSAQATASVFALEGAALVWLGLRQSRLLPQLTGAGLQMAAAFAFFIARADAWSSGGFDATAHPMFANAPFMSALLIALAGLASAWSYRGRLGAVAGLYYLWGLAWWLGNGVIEIERYLGRRDEPDAMLAFAALTGWLAAIGAMFIIERFLPAPLRPHEAALQLLRSIALALAGALALATLGWVALGWMAQAPSLMAAARLWQDFPVWRWGMVLSALGGAAVLAVLLAGKTRMACPYYRLVLGALLAGIAWAFRWALFMSVQGVPKFGAGLYLYTMPLGGDGLLGILGMAGLCVALVGLISWALELFPARQHPVAAI